MTSQKPVRKSGLFHYHISHQQTMPYPAVLPDTAPYDHRSHTVPHDHLYTPLPDLNPTISTPFPASLLGNLQESVTSETKKNPPLKLPAPEPDGAQEVRPEMVGVSGRAKEDSTVERTPAEAGITCRPKLQVVAIALVVILALAIYFIWRQAPASTTAPIVTSTTSNNTSDNTDITASGSSADAASGIIQVYVVGAVQHPGVYTLPADARVFQLLQTAGGPLANANLVAINMAAKLRDGQEVYVTLIGEKPPSYAGGVPGPGTDTSNSAGSGNTADQGQLVNINTASTDEMQQKLHVSSKTAQSIVDYREQHGAFTTVTELLQVVSQSIYDKIKGSVTV